MDELNKIELTINGKIAFTAVQFTASTKKQMLAINATLGAQAFQEKFIDLILTAYNEDGDKFIPIFYRNGATSFIEMGDWIYVKKGEVYVADDLTSLADVIISIKGSEVGNG